MSAPRQNALPPDWDYDIHRRCGTGHESCGCSMSCCREARESRRAAIVLEDVGKRLWAAVSEPHAALGAGSPAVLRQHSGIQRADGALTLRLYRILESMRR
jgi:hypothetical protein